MVQPICPDCGSNLGEALDGMFPEVPPFWCNICCKYSQPKYIEPEVRKYVLHTSFLVEVPVGHSEVSDWEYVRKHHAPLGILDSLTPA